MDAKKPIRTRRYGLGWIIFIIVALGALGFLIVGSFVGSIISENTLSKSGVPTIATATSASCGYHKAIEGDNVDVSFTPASQTQSVSAHLLVTEQACHAAKVNTVIPIVYDPAHPTTARIADLASNNPFWLSELWVFGFAAAIMAVVVVWTLVRNKN